MAVKHHIENHGAEHVEHHHHKRGGEATEHERRAEGGKMHTRLQMGEPVYSAHGGPVRRPRRARGGKSSPVNEYNAQGSPEMREAEDEKEEFKRGGRKVRKAGGIAVGERTMDRADKAPRGRHAKGGTVHHMHDHDGHGHVAHHHGEGDIHLHRQHGGEARMRRAVGGSVYSTGSKIEMNEGSPASRGKEGQSIPPEPKPG